MTAAPSSPTTVVLSYLAAFDQRDPEAIAAHVAPDFVNTHTASLGTGCEGRSAYWEHLPGFLESMPGLHYEVDQTVAEGREVAVFYTMTGRWLGQQAFTLVGAQRLRVENGLITHRTDYWDSARFLSQVDDEAAVTLRSLGLR
ncbi:MAG: nuclear transport factor 2 family protein [Actinomycetia bacterium]|nr:nuclear transport factor 2 family protein [Actinomycetes bacterium]